MPAAAKKSAVKKSTTKKPTTKNAAAKSPNKSSGGSWDSIYHAVEAVLLRYSPPLSTGTAWVKPGKKGIQLLTPEPVSIPRVYGGKPTKLMVAAVMEQKTFVGFYLFSIYMDPSLKKKIPAPLLKLLKGKSCFNLKSVDDALLAAIKQSIDATIADYRKKGWM
jgi:hypothetical protein